MYLVISMAAIMHLSSSMLPRTPGGTTVMETQSIFVLVAIRTLIPANAESMEIASMLPSNATVMQPFRYN